MDYIIDAENRSVIIPSLKRGGENTVINEYDTLLKKFLENTEDKYDCELVLIEVDIYDENNLENRESIGKELKAFARRKRYDNWLMEFNLEEYIV